MQKTYVYLKNAVTSVKEFLILHIRKKILETPKEFFSELGSSTPVDLATGTLLSTTSPPIIHITTN